MQYFSGLDVQHPLAGTQLRPGAESTERPSRYDQQAGLALTNLASAVSDWRHDLLNQYVATGAMPAPLWDAYAGQTRPSMDLALTSPYFTSGNRGSLFTLADYSFDTTAPDYSLPMVGAPANDTLFGAQGDQQPIVAPALPQSQPTELPPEVREQIERTNALYAGHQGQGNRAYTQQEIQRLFPARDVPRQVHDTNPTDHIAHPEGETAAVAAMKDIVAGMINHDSADPYHAVQKDSTQGDRVGRYGISAAQYRSWLVGLSDKQLTELTAESKLPQGALELAHFLKEHPDGADPTGQLQGPAKALNDFLTRMQQGGDLSKLDVDRFFNKYLQEKLASDLIRTYAHDTADMDPQRGGLMANIGKIALSMYAGHEIKDPGNDPRAEEIMDLAMKQWPIAVQKEQGVTNIDVINAGQRIAAVASANEGRALWQGSGTGGDLGCVSSVSNVLRQAGFDVHEINVQVLADHLQAQGWRPDAFANRRPGDVIVVGGYSHGHVGIVASDPNFSYDNHSNGNASRWQRDPIAMWAGLYRGSPHYVLHPPATTA